MDLLTSIFEDKPKKNRSSGKSRDKGGTEVVKKKKTVKSNASDKKPKPILKNNTVINGDKDNGAKNVVRHTSFDNSVKTREKEVENGFKQNDSRKRSESIRKEEVVENEIKAEPSLITNNNSPGDSYNNFVEDSFENSFETCLEVYNDCVFDEKDAAFGRESFTSLDQDFFVEAYNKEGSELVETWIQLSFNEQESDESFPQTFEEIIFVSDDERDDFFEAYNSREFQLRKVRSRDIAKYGPQHHKENKLEPEKVIKRELKNQNSMEAENIEEKSILGLINTPGGSHIGDRSSVQRSTSGVSSRSSFMFNSVSRNNSTSSRGSYSCSITNDFIEEDEKDFPKLEIPFKIHSKADMIIQEFLETEYTYIENLTIIKNDYIKYFKKINLDASRMFGNIEEILEETKNFYCSLHLCANDCEYIAKTIEDYRYLFELYPIYSLNKLKADNLVQKRFKPILQERQKILGHKLDLASYLLNPVQRLGRYILLLQNLQKSIRKPECLDNAIKLLEKAMKRGNDYVAIASISQCTIDLYKKGTYIDREKFTLLKPKREEIVVFLFENTIVLTLPQQNTENFVYKSSIDLDDLQIIHSEGDKQVFQLKNYTKSKKGNQELSYTLEGRSDKLTETWVQLIQSKLWEQLQQVKASSKTYKLPECNGNKKIFSSNSVKNDSGSGSHSKMGRASSDRNKSKAKTKFYVEETINGYETL
ncbi:triple functional domain protein-like [Onthophagus taurus]|uniref:triple functional domain protein-like n=1 Tax=Onthophagus taurus TaxID=166361 RepID=UPI0039BE5234